MDDPPEQDINYATERIAIIGAGTIGLSIAALHLLSSPTPPSISIFDTRPGLETYVRENLILLLDTHPTISSHQLLSHVITTKSLQNAVQDATIVQESCPEIPSLKQQLWKEIEEHAPSDALFWTSTSGISASIQSSLMLDKTRLLVVHPYNPPHIMPLLEIVPSPSTSSLFIQQTLDFWHARGRQPILVKKEVPGFVANRLAFALLREAIHLVSENVIGARDLDALVESSMGPRWAVAGPLKSYAAGGGEQGLEGFFDKIGETIGEVWEDLGKPTTGGSWRTKVISEVEQTYPPFMAQDAENRDSVTSEILNVVARKREIARKRERETKELGRAVKEEESV
ncbi:MAG: hypothetical protein M1820_005520 [Bogoriella megaspora]|nr:MAG: hypothetical protein M1820_005520 [Bogoriella megaspora]